MIIVTNYICLIGTENANELYSQIDQIDKQLASKCSFYGNYTQFLNTQYKDIKNALKEGEVAIDFTDFKLDSVHCYAAYVLRKEWVSSYVRGNFYNRGRISTESLRASDDLIFLNVHPNKDGSLSFENPRAFQGKGVTTWEGLIKSVRAKVKGTKVKIRLGASSGEWKAMVADEAARTTFAKNIKTVLEKNKLDGIDLDFEWAENEKEYKDYSLAILKMREVLGDKYLFSVSLHPVCYKISKEAIEAVDFISLQCYGPSPVRFPIEKYCSDIQMVLEYGIPKEKLVAGVPFYGVTKDNSKKTEAYFNFVQNGLVTSPAQNEVIYQGDTYVFDGQDNIRIKTRYAKEQKLKGMMSWDLATDLPLSDSRSLLKTMTEELRE